MIDMDYNDIFKNYSCDYNKLLEYGFILDDEYIYSKDINNFFKMEVRIKENYFNVKVIDAITSLEYIPFRVDTFNGNYVSNIRDLVNIEITNIINKCFNKCELLNELLNHLKSKYDTVPDYPFDDNESMVFRVNNKWYGLIMFIDRSKITNDKGKCIIINLKIDKDRIPNIIDNKNIFNAYHMNKKHWISVIIDNNLDMDYLYELIDESYNLVRK